MRTPTRVASILVLSLALPCAAAAQIAVVDNGDQKLTIGGYLQTQYERVDPDHAPARDRVFFRRIMLTVQATRTRNWLGLFQMDVAPIASGNRAILKDMYLQYLGLRDRGIAITIGNFKPPFSSSLLMSSSRRAFVERTFPGDRSFGGPGRALGIRADGWSHTRKIYWAGEVASTLHSPGVNQVRVDGLAEAENDWNEGVMTAGRVELHPFGEVPREQGGFRDGLRVMAAVGAYIWRNDGDRNLHTVDGAATSSIAADADAVRAIEVSGGLRAHRISIDAEYERVGAGAIVPSFTGGLYRDGEARLQKAGVEAGYMLLPGRWEIIGAADLLDAEAYAHTWRRASAGMNWYVDGHNLKFQVMHRLSSDEPGVAGAHSQTTYAQAQVLF